MRLRLFNLMAVLSLLLCVATVVLWLRCNRFKCDTLSWQRPGGIAYTMVSMHDRLMFMRATLSDRYAPTGFRHWIDRNAALGDQNNPTLGSRIGLRIEPTSIPRQWPQRGIGSERVPARCVYFPYWLLTIIFAVFPLWRAIAIVRAPRRSSGVCHNCGYDLRATPDRCPECGIVPARNQIGPG